jgi:hypothetical protein
MVSTSEQIKNIKNWHFENEICFLKIKDDSYYDWYKKGYNEFHYSNPLLKTKVTVNSIDSMRDVLNQGLLFYIELSGERIGLIAAERSKFLGRDGLYFHEIFLSKEYKGKGLAKAVQRKFISNFAVGNEFIWGTIDSSNLPSYKTANSNGRIAVRFECFIDL